MSIPVDVNEAFAAEKTGQLAAQRAARDTAIQREADKAVWLAEQLATGSVEQIGATTYRYTTGWDAGETFTVSRNRLGQLEEIEPNHGLDTTESGDVALYSAVPAWHALGQIIPGGTSDIDEVLRLGGIDFGVDLVPALYQWQGELRTTEGRFHTVRDDTGSDLGIVGRNYEVIQNRQLFEFLQELVASYDVVWESAGSMRGGSKVFVSMRLPEDVTVDADGINDQIIPFIVAVNTHDGCSTSQVVVTPWRPVCGNTERFAVRDAYTRWVIRHTKSATDRIKEARRTLGLSVKYFENWATEENQLAQTDLAIDDFHKVIADLWPLDDDPSDTKKKNADERRDQITGLFETEAKRVGRTAYAGERAITEHLDHFASIRPSAVMRDNVLGARGLRLLEGTDDETKSKAHKRLLLLRKA